MILAAMHKCVQAHARVYTCAHILIFESSETYFSSALNVAILLLTQIMTPQVTEIVRLNATAEGLFAPSSLPPPPLPPSCLTSPI